MGVINNNNITAMILQCEHPQRHQLNSNGHLTINIFDLYLGGGGVLRTKG